MVWVYGIEQQKKAVSEKEEERSRELVRDILMGDAKEKSHKKKKMMTC